MPNSMSLAQFAAIFKQRDPRLANVPDDVLVRKVLERRPEFLPYIQRMEARPSLMEHEGIQNIKQRLYALVKERVEQARALSEQTPWVAKNFHPGGPVDTFGRMITPGVKSVTPSAGDDPFYYQKIKTFLEQHGKDITPNTRQFFIDRRIIPSEPQKEKNQE